MGFASHTQVDQFLSDAPEFERVIVCTGVRLVKYWFSITDWKSLRKICGTFVPKFEIVSYFRNKRVVSYS